MAQDLIDQRSRNYLLYKRTKQSANEVQCHLHLLIYYIYQKYVHKSTDIINKTVQLQNNNNMYTLIRIMYT